MGFEIKSDGRVEGGLIIGQIVCYDESTQKFDKRFI
jgi:hypothetical protein